MGETTTSMDDMWSGGGGESSENPLVYGMNSSDGGGRLERMRDYFNAMAYKALQRRQTILLIVGGIVIFFLLAIIIYLGATRQVIVSS